MEGSHLSNLKCSMQYTFQSIFIESAISYFTTYNHSRIFILSWNDQLTFLCIHSSVEEKKLHFLPTYFFSSHFWISLDTVTDYGRSRNLILVEIYTYCILKTKEKQVEDRDDNTYQVWAYFCPCRFVDESLMLLSTKFLLRLFDHFVLKNPIESCNSYEKWFKSDTIWVV